MVILLTRPIEDVMLYLTYCHLTFNADESSLPPTVVLCVGNEEFSKNVLDSVQNQRDTMHDAYPSASQPTTLGSNISKSRPILPRVPSCSYRQNTGYNCIHNQGIDDNAFDGVRTKRRPQPRREHNFDPKTRVAATRSDYLAVRLLALQ